MDKIQVRPKILLAVSVLVAAVCALLIPSVNVNSDMTRYLPDDSRMKQGLDILKSEFGQSASAADVRIMMESVSEEEMDAVRDSISRIEGVDAVSVTRGSGHTLFELNVAKSVHQKRLASRIKKSFPYTTVTQTSQDGNTPDPKAIILAVICLAVILLIMSRSYLEPVLFLCATGMAVAVNMGTNYFLDSVSITTHSIAAVLQLALSMDYSIILMSRYRQQRRLIPDKYEAMSSACRKASPAILSSSFTTVTGLLMLVFMNLKIGMDLGVVLAKGVVCSLIFTYTALPGLILIFEKGIKATEKKVPVPNADRLAAFCGKFRIPLTVLFVVLFAMSWRLSTRTPISFSTSTPSAIDRVFPKKNAVVVLYDNAQEDSVASLLDTVSSDPGVEAVYSYPTIMKKKMGAEEMVAMLQEKAAEQGESRAQMLTPELMRICYYAKFGDKNLKIGFTELVAFVTSMGDSPLLEGVEIPDLEEKIDLLNAMVQTGGVHGPAEDDDSPKMTVREYMTLLHSQQNSADTRMLLSLTDVSKLRSRMTVEQMTAYMGSTPAQTRMVYSFSKSAKEGMTPVEFAHFLTDDLFNRKALAKMVSREQKDGMLTRERIMDAAVTGELLGRDELDALVLKYGLKEALRDVPAQAAAEAAAPEDAAVPPVVEDRREEAAPPVSEPEERAPEAVEDPRMVLLEQMLRPGKKYDAAGMARNFRALGENVDDATVSMLYALYGSGKFYDPEWKMNLEELVEFLDTFLPDEYREQFDAMKTGLEDGVSALKGPGHSIAAIITGYPDESAQTEKFVRSLGEDNYLIGESVMFCEMKDGFHDELRLITLLTILAIFAIVAFTFRSPLTAAILVMGVMSSVFVNVVACGIGGHSMLYLAYLIVQSILMGATIDYGILFTTFYRENRDLREAYRGSIHTILTSGLIICCVPGAMALLLDDAMIQPIVKNLAVGSFAAIVIVLFILPGVLALVFPKKK